MIITCPSCATRYDVEDSSFSPDGRSVLCAVCENSWFVPAPTPISALLKKNPAAAAPSPAAQPVEDDDDTLFDIVDPDEAKPEPPMRDVEKPATEERFPDHEAEDTPPAAPAPDEALAFEPEEAGPAPTDHVSASREEPSVVDADFDDVDDERRYEKGFGRRLRQDRRRATALTRLEDLDETAERVFNDEFFKALHVQPKELEKALRKARRRAESREKNRLTPLRAVGWSVWACVVIATIFVAYRYRDDIVDKWPNASVAYAVVGIDAAPKGLKIDAIEHRIAMSTVGPTIELTGEVFNDSEETLPAPLMQAEALDAKGALLSRWTFEMDVSEINANGRAPFMTRSPAPEGVTEIALTFAPKPTIEK